MEGHKVSNLGTVLDELEMIFKPEEAEKSENDKGEKTSDLPGGEEVTGPKEVRYSRSTIFIKQRELGSET